MRSIAGTKTILACGTEKGARRARFGGSERTWVHELGPKRVRSALQGPGAPDATASALQKHTGLGALQRGSTARSPSVAPGGRSSTRCNSPARLRAQLGRHAYQKAAQCNSQRVCHQGMQPPNAGCRRRRPSQSRAVATGGEGSAAGRALCPTSARFRYRHPGRSLEASVCWARKPSKPRPRSCAMALHSASFTQTSPAGQACRAGANSKLQVTS